MDIGVRELKAKLSATLQRAAAGEVITVTDRGRPVAVIGPPPGTIDLSQAVEDGWILPATSTGLKPVPRHQARMPVLAALAEDRGE